MGVLWCLMYWVEWNTLKARPARKSLDERSPATGLNWNPVTPASSSSSVTSTSTWTTSPSSSWQGRTILLTYSWESQTRVEVEEYYLQSIRSSPPAGETRGCVRSTRGSCRVSSGCCRQSSRSPSPCPCTQPGESAVHYYRHDCYNWILISLSARDARL